MIQFVKNWIRENTEKGVIEKDQTDQKWTKCDEGLPHTARKVQVLLCLGHNFLDDTVSTQITTAKFNPFVGWEISGNRGIVMAWRDLDEQIRNIMDDMDLVKKLSGTTGIKVK